MPNPDTPTGPNAQDTHAATERLQRLIHRMPCYAAYKRPDSVFSHGNLAYARVVGLTCAEDVIGRTAYDMPARSAECAPLSHAQDARVLAAAKTLDLLGIHPDKGGAFKAYHYRKTPVLAYEGGVAGIFATGHEVTSAAMYELARFLFKIPIQTEGKLLLDNGSYLIGLAHAQVPITPREHEVLFFLLRRKRAQTIADMLGITPRTVYKYASILRDKFAVRTSAELRDAASARGFVDILPPRLFDPRICTELNRR